MNKENIMFGIIGLVAGLVIGFVAANSVNRNAMTSSTETSGMSQNSNVPPGHPDISGMNPQSPDAMANMPQVKEALQKAKDAPDDYDAQLKAALFYYQINKLDEAIETVTKANKLKPEEVQPLVILGNIYFDQEKYEDAEKWYADALKKTPDDISVRTDFGLTFVLRKTPDYDRAIEEFNKSLKVDPKHLQTLQNLTVAYTKKGDAANAKSTLAKIAEIDSTNASIAKLQGEIDNIGKK